MPTWPPGSLQTDTVMISTRRVTARCVCRTVIAIGAVKLKSRRRVTWLKLHFPAAGGFAPFHALPGWNRAVYLIGTECTSLATAQQRVGNRL